METELIYLAVEGLRLAIQKEPQIEQAIMDWLKKDNPTDEERAALRLRIDSGTYKNLVPHSKLPPVEFD